MPAAYVALDQFQGNWLVVAGGAVLLLLGTVTVLLGHDAGEARDLSSF